MLSGGFFDDDPFFAGHRQQMRQMDQLFHSPFGFPQMNMAVPPPAIQQRVGNHHQQRQQQQQQLVPVDMFGFGGLTGMFQNMRRMMDDMHATFDSAAKNPNSQVFSQSTFMSYSSMGGAQPKVYQASSSSTQGPGGVREMRKMVRDSESGVEKMSVGRHLGSRGHVIERQRNRRTGDQEENQEYINMDEGESSEFNREWQEQSRVRGGSGRLDYRRQDRADRRYRALPAPSQRHSHSHGHGHSHGHSHHGHSHRTPSYRDRE
ncbi:myeloid leukemia factor 2-like [Babylonia areolata]|uniref:myeloid leukemia factor 2-like n=1 Tax=Babylonia areolata TaxID=304850 RepID=UPI003FD5FFDF